MWLTCLLPARVFCPWQRIVEKIESNIRELEEKLAHEKAKFAEYDVVLKEKEKRRVGADGILAC